MDISIRPLKKSDIDHISKVFMETFNSSGENWNIQASKKHVNDYLTGNSQWGAYYNTKLIGILLAVETAIEDKTMLFIDTVAVLPEYQKKEVGTKLWNEMGKYIKENDLNGIRLLANKDFKSYSWYKKLGFMESGWIELYKTL